MSYALVDNALLTGVQRITGEISSRSRDSVDTDIVALENLIQTMLFYDRIVAIDNYKAQYRENRVSSFPFVEFLDPSAFNLSDIERIAYVEAGRLKPEIRGGEFADDDFRAFLELLKTHIVCTWDISSSVYYLTLKALAEEGSVEFEKYGNLAAGIFAELFDATNVGGRPKGGVLLVDSYGEEVRDGYTIPDARWGHGATGGMTGALAAFVSSLVWLANRSIFYSLTAKYLKSDTFLYPIRQAYQQHYMSSTCKYGFDFTKRIVDAFSKKLSADLISIQESGLAIATATDLPVFAAWLVRETGDAAQVIRAAMEIRNDREIAEARDQLREIRRLFDEVGIAEANKAVRKIVSGLSKTSEKLRSRYGVGTKQGTPITRLIRVYNTIAAIKNLPQLPEYDIRIKLPEFLANFSAESGFNALYRNVGDDLTTVWALGEARDILGARVRLYKDGQAAYHPKAENPEYRWAHSTWKSPM